MKMQVQNSIVEERRIVQHPWLDPRVLLSNIYARIYTFFRTEAAENKQNDRHKRNKRELEDDIIFSCLPSR